MVTIKDVAKEAGVAISTVSNVLNGVDVVTEPTRQKVLRAVEKLGYVPNMSAKSLKNSKNRTIGLFLRSIQGDYYRVLMQAIDLECKERNYMLNIYVSNVNTSEEVYGMILSSCVEGAIVLNENLEEEHLSRLEKEQIPIVFFDREYSSEHISSIIIDDRNGARAAVEYLVGQGHKRIAFIHGAESHDNTLRFENYLSVLREKGLPYEKKWIGYGEFGRLGARDELLRILEECGGEEEWPDAVFCANDDMAFGCIDACVEKGIQVPEQISVIGYDDCAMAKYFRPSLTTIRTPIEELGKQGIAELFRLMDKKEMSGGVVKALQPQLIVRESSCKKE